MIIFLALAAALAAYTATARDDATAIVAYRVASIIGSAACDAVGTGDTYAYKPIDIPGLICGMPYMAYPQPDCHNITICIGSGPTMLEYTAPVPLRAGGVKMSGFIASPPAGHTVAYDPATRTVTMA
jgi:hypothetical protein